MKITPYLTALLLLFSFTTLAQIGIDRLYTGQTMDEARSLYPEAAFKKVDGWSYCVDGESESYVISIDEKPHFFINSIDDGKTITGISILSEDYSPMKGLHVGNTFNAIHESYPELELRIDDLCNYEYLYLADMGMTIVFRTTEENRIGTYTGSPGDYKRIGFSKNTSRKVDWISL